MKIENDLAILPSHDKTRVEVQEELDGVLVGLELLFIQMSVGLCACLLQSQDP